MSRRFALAAALLAASAASAQAGTLTDSFAAFSAGVGGLVNRDSSVGVADGTTTLAVPLAGGATLVFVPPVTKDNLSDDAALAPFADGYTGDVFEANTASVTIRLPGDALGFTVYTNSTDFLGSSSYLTAVSSSDGQSLVAQLPTYNPAVGQVGRFFGYFGGGATSVTISSSDPELFTIAEIVDAPEPASAAALAAGLLGLAWARRARPRG